MKRLIYESPYTCLLSIVFTLLSLHRIIGGIPSLTPVASVVVVAISLSTLAIIEAPRIYTPMAILLLYICVNIGALNPPVIFQPWQRFCLFASMMIVVSPLIQNSHMRNMRQICLNISLITCIAISIISFIGFFWGVNMMENQADMLYTEKAGLFGGITKHSIILGIISGIGICTLVYKAIVNKWQWIIVAIPCISSLMLSASRGALYATIIGCLVMIFIAYKNNIKRSNIKNILLFTIPAIILIVSQATLIDGFSSKRIDRNETSILSSRMNKIDARIEEFKSSPIFGIGFSTVDINGADNYDIDSGTIEPGVSWLAILSMTGIVGLVIILYIFYSCIKYISKSNNPKIQILFMGLITFFSISMFSEGYIFAAGSTLCVLLWLVIGVCIDTYYCDNI